MMVVVVSSETLIAMSRHKSSATYFSESPREGGNFSDSVVEREVRDTGVATNGAKKGYNPYT
jgi:hypothetical protein